MSKFFKRISSIALAMAMATTMAVAAGAYEARTPLVSTPSLLARENPLPTMFYASNL